MTIPEHQLEDQSITKHQGLRYKNRADIQDRAALVSGDNYVMRLLSWSPMRCDR